MKLWKVSLQQKFWPFCYHQTRNPHLWKSKLRLRIFPSILHLIWVSTQKTAPSFKFCQILESFLEYELLFAFTMYCPPIIPYSLIFVTFINSFFLPHLASCGEDTDGFGGEVRETSSRRPAPPPAPAPAPAPPLEQECLASPPPLSPFSSFSACRLASQRCPAGWRFSSKPCSTPC